MMRLAQYRNPMTCAAEPVMPLSDAAPAGASPAPMSPSEES